MDDENDEIKYIECENNLMRYDRLHWKVALTRYQSYKNFNKIYTYILKKIICNFWYESPNSIYSLYINDWILLSAIDVNKYIYALVINIIPNDFDFSRYKVICQCIHSGKIIEITYNSKYLLVASIKEFEIINILNLNLELVNKCLNIQKKKDMYDITNRVICCKTNVCINWK